MGKNDNYVGNYREMTVPFEEIGGLRKDPYILSIEKHFKEIAKKEGVLGSHLAMKPDGNIESVLIPQYKR